MVLQPPRRRRCAWSAKLTWRNNSLQFLPVQETAIQNKALPRLLTALREHPHVGWVLVRSEQDGPVVLGGGGAHYLADGRVVGEDPLAPFPPNTPAHLLRTDGFDHVADLMVGSFYDPSLEEGCAFEELISFHGGLGGPQTQAFILSPPQLELPAEPLVGAAAVLAFALLIAVVRSLPGPVFFPLRALAIVYADFFRGVPTILVIAVLGFGAPGLGLSAVPTSTNGTTAGCENEPNDRTCRRARRTFHMLRRGSTFTAYHWLSFLFRAL